MSRSGRFLGWFFLIISVTWYTQSSMGATLTSPPKNLDPNNFYNQGLTNLSKPILQEKNNQGFDGREHYMEKQHMSIKGQRGRGTGVYGGANVAHRRPPQKNSASNLFNNYIININIVTIFQLIIVSSLIFFIPN